MSFALGLGQTSEMAQYTAFAQCIYVRWILSRQLENDKIDLI